MQFTSDYLTQKMMLVLKELAIILQAFQDLILIMEIHFAIPSGGPKVDIYPAGHLMPSRTLK